jgi:hypothetical protein
MVVRSGGRRQACALAAIREVIRLPDMISRLDGEAGARWLTSYRDMPLPLLALDTAMPADRAAAMVLVAQIDGSAIGIVVDEVETIAHAVAVPSPKSGGPVAELRTGHFIETEIDGLAAAITIFAPADLLALARREQTIAP